MFGSRKIQELESQVSRLEENLSREKHEKETLNQKLEAANARIREMEQQLNDFDLEKLKEAAAASKAEFEGLKELYARKNKEFDDAKEEAEQNFARDAALQRHNLDTEIRNNRQASQEYVTNTVRSFGESYNYYLNQIRLLMDALGDVATRTGEALFSGENADLKARFGGLMRDALKSGTDSLKGEDGVIVIGSADTEEKEAESPEDNAKGGMYWSR